VQLERKGCPADGMAWVGWPRDARRRALVGWPLNERGMAWMRWPRDARRI